MNGTVGCCACETKWQKGPRIIKVSEKTKGGKKAITIERADVRNNMVQWTKNTLREMAFFVGIPSEGQEKKAGKSKGRKKGPSQEKETIDLLKAMVGLRGTRVPQIIWVGEQ